MPSAFSWFGRPISFATVALPLFFFSPDKSRVDLEATYPGDYRLVDSVRLRLRDTGPRDAPVVILLHGFCASLDTWEPWAQSLSARFRVIRFDLPGFGLTGPDPTGDYSDARAIQILSDLMDQLGVGSASLVGNSMGGRIVWNFAALHPERVTRMVLISPDGFARADLPYDRPPEASLFMWALPYLAPPRSLLKLALASAYARLDAIDETTLTRYRDLLLAPGVRHAILSRARQVISHDPTPLLARIRAPTLLLWGEKDEVIPISNATAFLRYLPGATLVRLQNLGHVPFEEDPVASLAPLQRFLSGRTP